MTSILLTSVNGVYHKESEGVKKETIKKQMKNLSPNCCLLVTEEKTLDLTFKNNRVMSLVTSALKDLIKSTDQEIIYYLRRNNVHKKHVHLSTSKVFVYPYTSIPANMKIVNM